jgi:hypothetical protein
MGHEHDLLFSHERRPAMTTPVTMVGVPTVSVDG